MGQRTAIILQHVNKYAAKWGNSKEVNTRVFYHQWGIGRVLPSQLLAILNGSLSASDTREDFAREIKPQGCIDITNDFTEEERNKMDSITFDTPEAAGDIIRQWDNNGGLFVRIITSESGETLPVEYAYMLGAEEGGNYRRFCTGSEWMDKAGGRFADKDWRKIYDAVVNYHGAIERARGEGK